MWAHKLELATWESMQLLVYNFGHFYKCLLKVTKIIEEKLNKVSEMLSAVSTDFETFWNVNKAKCITNPETWFEFICALFILWFWLSISSEFHIKISPRC